MVYTQLTYGKNLPANLGTDKVLRAIYDKIDSSTSSVKIEEKLDNIYDLLIVVNNNIESNTQAIKDISINVDIHSKDLMSITNAINQLTEAIKNIKVHIDTTDLNNSIKKLSNNVETGFNKVEDGFNKTTDAIKSLQPSPQPRPTPPVPPRPVPPCPPPHPHPHHHIEPDIIFCPVPLSLPAPLIIDRPAPPKKVYNMPPPQVYNNCCHSSSNRRTTSRNPLILSKEQWGEVIKDYYKGL